jgi:hypothetical protein
LNHILYHDNCYDGFGAAYAAWSYFTELGNSDDFCMHAMKYHSPLPDVIAGDTVYMLDYSRKADDLVALLKQNVDIEIHDHHKTAEPEYNTARALVPRPPMGSHRLQGTFDMKKSGAVLAWERFWPDRRVPLLFKLIQNRDLWEKDEHDNFTMEDTDRVHAALCSLPYDFYVWDSYIKGMQGSYPGGVEDDRTDRDIKETDSYRDLCTRGDIILEYHQVLTEQLCQQARLMNIGGYEVPVANVSILFSEVPHRLLQLYPQCQFAAYRYYLGDGRVQFGLRGRGDFDVSAVALKFGGGGHKSSAGFTVDRWMQ